MHATAAPFAGAAPVVIDPTGLETLIVFFRARGDHVIGPRQAGVGITWQPIEHAADLPRGWTATQAPGTYRLHHHETDGRLFAFGPTADSLKRLLHPPIDRLWVATREKGALTFEPLERTVPRITVIGVRPCELEAIARLDRVFLHGPAVDPAYQARREALTLVAVNCTEPGGTCFCASMGTGPRATALYDVALTELPDGRMTARAATPAGLAALAAVSAEPAQRPDLEQEEALITACVARMGRRVHTEGLPERLAAAVEHPAWDTLAERCLACANCTMSCPTCFCHTIDDRTDLSGTRVERERRWDTCFSAEFSYIHGGSIRPSVRARYRQWLTHKFSTWTDQFGTFGCVGCGRCVTWCPVGIDHTDALAQLTCRGGMSPEMQANPAQS